MADSRPAHCLRHGAIKQATSSNNMREQTTHELLETTPRDSPLFVDERSLHESHHLRFVLTDDLLRHVRVGALIRLQEEP